MSTQSDASALIELLQLPQPELQSLSFCKSNRVASVKTWVEHLPATQINRTGILLYQAVPEVAKLVTSASTRLEMLEALRPFVQQNLLGLTRHFIDRPLLHSEAAMKTAIISQAIQRYMSQGYGQVAEDILRGRSSRKIKPAERKILALALHRALTGLGLQLLRSAQIYTQPPRHLWHEINSLYRIAENLELLKIPCLEPLLQKRAAITLEQVYMRILMLDCARPNQLNPKEIDLVFGLTENWCAQVKLQPNPGSDRDLYAIELSADSAPVYRSTLAEAQNSGADIRYLALSPLLDAVKKQVDQEGGEHSIIEIPANLPEGVLQHLLQAWGEEQKRAHARNKNNITLEVSVGLTSIHYHLAGQMLLRDFVRDNNASSRFQMQDHGQTDAWDKAFVAGKLGRSDLELGLNLNMHDPKTAGGAAAAVQASPFSVHRVQMLDFSSDGMRIDWRDNIPAQLKTGELISVMEASQPPRIGVIRWARQHKHGTQLGIQIIGHRCEPAAAQLLNNVGDDNVFMHAILVAMPRSTGDPDQLITAIHPFRVRSKVRIRDRDRTFTALLTEQRLSTGSISQFNFRLQDSVASTVQRAKPDDDDTEEDFVEDW